jgi:Heterokaryon incompatibility protein (HET)
MFSLTIWDVLWYYQGYIYAILGGFILPHLGIISLRIINITIQPWTLMAYYQVLKLFLPIRSHVLGSTTDSDFLAWMQIYENELYFYLAATFSSTMASKLWQLRTVIIKAFLSILTIVAVIVYINSNLVGYWIQRICVSVIFHTPTTLLSVRGIFFRVFEYLCFQIHHLDVSLGRKKRLLRKPLCQTYPYRSLESPRHIRLLQIRRRQLFHEPLCEIIHVHINDAPPYEALSYVWGQRDPSIPLKIGDYQLFVTQSVEEFLFYHRSFFSEKMVWIDSICINQGSDDEKSEQLPLMREIYGKALRTIAWLGPPETFLQSHYIRQVIMAWHTAEVFGVPPEGMFEFESTTSSAQRSYREVRDLISQPWFRRLWIVQEAIVSKKVHVLFKGTSIDLDDILLVLDNIHKSFDRLVELDKSCLDGGVNMSMPQSPTADLSMFTRNFATAVCLANLREVHKFEGQIMWVLLLATKSFECQNPRDKIFAILGLTTSDSHVLYAKAGYKDPIEHVFLQTSTYLLSTTEWFLVLTWAGRGYEADFLLDVPNLQLKMPSWAVNFYNQPKWEPSACLLGDTSSLSDTSSRVTFTLDPRIIQISCAVYDTIHHIGPRLVMETKAGYNILGKLRDGMELEGIIQFQTIVERIRAWYLETRDLVHAYSEASMTSRQLADQELWTTCLSVGRLFNQQMPFPCDLQKMQEIFEYCVLDGSFEDISEQAVQEKLGVSGDDGSNALVRGVVCLYSLAGERGGMPLCITSNGRLMITPPLTERGDVVVHVRGGFMPLILRKIQTETGERRAELIGACYAPQIESADSISDWEEWLFE